MTCSLNLREQLLFSRKGLIPKYVLGVTVFGVTQKKLHHRPFLLSQRQIIHIIYFWGKIWCNYQIKICHSGKQMLVYAVIKRQCECVL